MKKKVLSLIVSAMSLGVSPVYGGPASNGGVLTINGEVISNTCTVSGNGQGKYFTVVLPDVSSSELSDAGAIAGSTGFSIALSNCTPDSGTVHTYWEYGNNTLTDGNLLNNGTATQVEVQLLDYNGGEKTIDVSKGDGAQNSHSVSIESGSANLRYAAQYISPTGVVTSGSVATSVTYSMVYQ